MFIKYLEMKSERINARELYKAPLSWFFATSPTQERVTRQKEDDYFVRGWTYDRIDKNAAKKENILFWDVPGDIVDNLEGYHSGMNLSPATIKGWNFDESEIQYPGESEDGLSWNGGGCIRLFDYMENSLNKDEIIDTDHEYYRQRILVDSLNFAADLVKTKRFYDKIYSADPIETTESVLESTKKFEKHVNALHRLYESFNTDGWKPSWTIPVLETPGGKYVVLDKCTVACIAGIADIEVQIDVILST